VSSPVPNRKNQAMKFLPAAANRQIMSVHAAQVLASTKQRLAPTARGPGPSPCSLATLDAIDLSSA
jgi:hypothetical protein